MATRALPTVNLTFPHHWTAEILPTRPLILPKRAFIYPRAAEEIERGALEVLVHPTGKSALNENVDQSAPFITRPAPQSSGIDSFLATCALGFADPAAPTGIWSCPDLSWLCAVSGGYAYLIDTTHPERFEQVEYRPVLEVHVLREHALLLFVGHHSLLAWGANGKAWQTARLSAEGVTVIGIEGDLLHGTGWDLLTDTDIPFTINLLNGRRLE